MHEKQIPIEITGRDLADLEKAASDMGVPVAQLFETAARQAVHAIFKINQKAPAVVLPFKNRLTAL